jgi:hypothetical protein
MVDVIVDVTCAVVTADRDAMMAREDLPQELTEPLQLISARDGRGREGMDVPF